MDYSSSEARVLRSPNTSNGEVVESLKSDSLEHSLHRGDADRGRNLLSRHARCKQIRRHRQLLQNNFQAMIEEIGLILKFIVVVATERSLCQHWLGRSDEDQKWKNKESPDSEGYKETTQIICLYNNVLHSK